MAISITAVPNSAGYVAISITGGGSASLVMLSRSDANGTSLVRLYEGQDLSSGELYVNDAEAALTGSIVYTVVTDLPETANASTSFTGSLGVFLTPVQMPNEVTSIAGILEYENSRKTNSTVHHIINRSDPVVSIGVLSTRTGWMEILCADYPTANAIKDVLASSQILMLRQPDHAGLDMYFVALTAGAAVLARETSPQTWAVQVEFQEVGWPDNHLLGAAGWTIADALARNATIFEELTEFEIISEAVVGP